MSSLSTGLGTVSLSGGATGVNTSALVDELVSAASGPKNQVQTKINNYNQLSSLYTTLNSKISAIDTALQAIDTSSEFREFTGTTTDEDSSQYRQMGMRLPVLMKSTCSLWRRHKSIRLILITPTPVEMICSPVITMELGIGAYQLRKQ